MSYSQSNQASNPPWSASNYPNNGNAQQSAQQWQYSQYSAPGTTSTQQQYANYYQQQQQPAASTADQQAYYQQYYQQYNQQYSNPPPPGVEGPPGVNQSSAPPGTSSYNYNYSQYPGYYSQNSHNQQPTYSAPAQPPQTQQYQYQQQQYPNYSQQQQQRPRPPIIRPPHQATNQATTTYQAAPVMNKPQQKIPPWSKKPRVDPPPPPPPVSNPVSALPPQPPAPPAPAAQSAEDKAHERNAMAVETWPPSLRQYVQDVFDNCLPNKRDQAEVQLRNVIIESHKAGTLLTTDWSEMDLPSACKATPTKKKKKGKKNQTKNNAPKPNVPAAPRPIVSSEEEARRLRRLRRFEEDAAQFRAENVSTPMQMMSLDSHDFNDTVVGTSQKLEKNYLRLTSAPDPATVRPLEVLKKTLELLREKWKAEQNYTYICDQFKSMRQDLTVQRIKNEFTVQVYEIHARIALEKSDLGEYNQCQTQLKSLYASGIDGHVMEFTAYRILYFLHTQNWSDVNSTMADLTPEQKQNEFVQHALKVRSSLATGNYHLFFSLYRSAPNMGGYLMDHFCERERVHALIILCKSYRPDIPLDFIQNELAFESDQELLKFLAEQKANVFKDQEKNALDARLALAGLTESVKKYKKIDIKGQL